MILPPPRGKDQPRHPGRIVFVQVMDLLPMHAATSGQPACTHFLLLGLVVVHGLGAISLPRNAVLDRNMTACDATQTLPRRDSRAGFAQHTGRRQRDKKLAHLRRLHTNGWAQSRQSLLRDPYQTQHGGHATHLVDDRQVHCIAQRPNDPAARFVFLTNNFTLAALTITPLHKTP